MKSRCFPGAVVYAVAGICLSIPMAAQDLQPVQEDLADAPRVRSLVTEPVDRQSVVQLKGNTHPMARAEFDRGGVDPRMPMERMLLVLKRSPEQEAALEKFMAEQVDPTSPNFHHWLEPEEFGTLYGPSDYDIQAVTGWLSSEGFMVNNVTKGKLFIEFSGTAGGVRRAFHTEIHRYMVNGEEHTANTADPSIPAALRQVVVGVFSLHNFEAKPMHREMGNFRQDSKTGKWIPLDDSVVTRPFFNVPSSSFELVSPFDFATIYNVTPLWNAGIDGTGQTIAIAGRSDITLSDVATFRSSFGLPAKAPTIIVNGPDPGVPTANDKVENTLDVEWSGAVAKNATIKFVTTASTQTTDGASASAIYIIDNKVAPVMSFSYGNCELAYGTAGNAANNSMWQQAAAQGITAFVASGDQGAAACDGGQPSEYAAQFGLAVSGPSSTPYNVAVGGTDLNWANNSGTSYWNSTNATNGSSAKGYMPEVPWNGTCASDAVDKLIGGTAAGWDEETTCEQIILQNIDTFLINVVGGTGGKSACTTPSSNTVASCSGGYAKPSWQTGTGVPADGKRDVPDLSLFASGGTLNTAYVICDSQSAPCTYTITNDALAQGVGGTSVASPAMAGIMALVNQKMGSAQGNANVAFYALAAKDNRAACNSITVAAGNACNFYDITTDNNAVPCSPGSPNCTVHHSGDAVGILTGNTSTTGYDLTTGLGTVNANNLVNNWSTVVATAPAISLTPTTLTFASTTVGSTTAAQTVTVKNTGTAAATLTSETLTGANASSYLISANTCTSSLAAGASCTVSLEFKPAAAGNLTASLSVADNATGSPQTVSMTGTGVTPTLTISLSPATLTFASTTEGVASAAQAVTVKNSGTSTVTLTSETLTGTNASSYLISANTCTASLAAGASCAVSVEFKPTAAGTLTASLSVADNATGSPQTVSMTGTGVAPTLTVSLTPTSLAFASTAQGSLTAAQTVTLKNTGTGTITLTSETLTGTNPTSYIITANTCASSLAAGASCAVSVEFKPAATGTLTANLAFADNATGSPQNVAMTGTGVATATNTISVSPTSLSFGSVALGLTSAAQVVTLKNTGTGTLTLTSETLAGTDPADYVKSAMTCGSSLPVAGTCTVSIQFKPAITGALPATLSIVDNATGSPQSVTLSGTGIPSNSVTLTPVSITFPNTVVGTTSQAQVVTLTNVGSVAATVTSVALTGTNPTDFVELNGCGSSLAAGAACSIYVAFAPASAAAFSATLTVTDSASGSPQSVALKGTGTSVPSVKLSTTSIAFPTTTHGTTSAPQTVTLTNTGTATLNLTSITLTGANPADFEALNGCGPTLAAGTSCSVYVAFRPASAAAFTAMLSIADNGASSPQSVALSGTGN